ncbi:MAG: MarR family winged helix-turn-helix transcriptional regulator [Eggerthellaceae bacterium]|jgi:MarR family 2-MHQ and catechol resistance regulon transcriptional repressor
MNRKDSYIVIYTHRLANQLDRITSGIVRAHGLTLPQFGVLEALYTKGSLPIGKVKDLVLSSDGTIPLIVRNLEKAGYITNEPDPGDGRRKILSLTDVGRAVIEPAVKENEHALSQCLADWSPEEKTQLVKLLSKHSVGA